MCRGNDDEGKAWSNTKKLGSLLGNNEDYEEQNRPCQRPDGSAREDLVK